MKKIKIAIDGHSSSGKSTIAKEIAKKFGYIYVDSGAMYRAATLFFLRKNILPEDPKLNEELDQLKIEFKELDNHSLPIVHLNGENVEDEIRTLKVSSAVSFYSKLPELRKKLVEEQQSIGQNGGIVMDGRDIGSMVFPDAELKLFMTASAEIRAQRRFDELATKGEKIEYQDILNNVIIRDKEDSSRKESPLIQVEDAILLDNSDLSQEEQLDFVINLIEQKLK